MRYGIAWLLTPIMATGLLIATTKANTPNTTTKPTRVNPTPAQKRTPTQARPAAQKVDKPVLIPKNILSMFPALPKVFPSAKNPLTPAKITLGRMLYYDGRLSLSGKFSCNSCHDLAKYGVDNKAFSDGHNGQKGERNSPTVYNAALHTTQFWDSRSPDVEDQAKQPILNPLEMAAPNEAWVVQRLKAIPGYVTAFQRAYPKDKDPVTYNNMAAAIGAFERKLSTPSRWDRFVQGDKKALSNKEKKGFMTFLSVGCATCHMGPLFGGLMAQKLGLTKPWPGVKDTGIFKVTKNPVQKYFFKVPSLRNVEKTAPYLHDGSIATLPKVVEMMAWYQSGRKLTQTQVNEITTFLKALTGTIPTAYIKQPKLP